MRSKEIFNPVDLARRLLDDGKEVEAQQVILTHRKHAPDDPAVHLKWGELCEELGMARQARECYEKALRLDPKDVDALFRLASLLTDVGHYEEAIHYLRKVLRLDADHPGARRLLAGNYEAVGLPGKAKAVSGGKKSPDAAPPIRYFPPGMGKNEIKTFLDLFSGREVGFALQQIDPDTGESKMTFQPRPMTAETIKEHLLGKITIAAYPLRSDNTIRYIALSIRIPARTRQAHAGQQSYLLHLSERMRDHVIKLARFARTLGIPAYPEETGAKGFRLWFFFEEFTHFLRVKGFLKEFIKHAPPPDSHIMIEPLLPTRPVGVGWVEQCILLPLGIDRTSLCRCLFVKDDGEPHENQLNHLKAIRKFRPEWAGKRLRLLAPDTGSRPLAGSTITFPPLVERLRSRCPVIAHLIQKGLSGQILRRGEKIVLFYSVGLLADGNSIHMILEPCPDYDYRKVKNQVDRLQQRPISCIKIRSSIPEITASVKCECNFDLRGGKYPSPMMHVMPQMVPASAEMDIPDHLRFREAAERYVRLRMHMEEEARIMNRLEKTLERDFSRKGISQYLIGDTRIVREHSCKGASWRLERA